MSIPAQTTGRRTVGRGREDNSSLTPLMAPEVAPLAYHVATR